MRHRTRPAALLRAVLALGGLGLAFTPAGRAQDRPAPPAVTWDSLDARMTCWLSAAS
jgi:hypothetical protein